MLLYRAPENAPHLQPCLKHVRGSLHWSVTHLQRRWASLHILLRAAVAGHLGSVAAPSQGERLLVRQSPTATTAGVLTCNLGSPTSLAKGSEPPRLLEARNQPSPGSSGLQPVLSLPSAFECGVCFHVVMEVLLQRSSQDLTYCSHMTINESGQVDVSTVEGSETGE